MKKGGAWEREIETMKAMGNVNIVLQEPGGSDFTNPRVVSRRKEGEQVEHSRDHKQDREASSRFGHPETVPSGHGCGRYCSTWSRTDQETKDSLFL